MAVDDFHVVLLGLMGAGKTEVGRILAERLGRELVDGDDVLEEENGRTAREIAERDGLAALHRLEAVIVLEALARAEPAVIGPAASVIESPEVRDALRPHLVVWLTASAEHLAADVADGEHRPLVHDGDPLPIMQRQLAVRQPLATELATLVLDVSDIPEDDLAQLVLDAVAAR